MVVKPKFRDRSAATGPRQHTRCPARTEHRNRQRRWVRSRSHRCRSSCHSRRHNFHIARVGRHAPRSRQPLAASVGHSSKTEFSGYRRLENPHPESCRSLPFGTNPRRPQLPFAHGWGRFGFGRGTGIVPDHLLLGTHTREHKAPYGLSPPPVGAISLTRRALSVARPDAPRPPPLAGFAGA